MQAKLSMPRGIRIGPAVVNALLLAVMAGFIVGALVTFSAWGYYASYVGARVGMVPESELAPVRADATRMFLCFVGGQLAALGAALAFSVRVLRSGERAIRAGIGVVVFVITNLIVFELMFG